MCDVHVFLKTGETQEKILESVEYLEADGEQITARNIFGEEKTVRARFTLFDSSQNTIILKALDP
ncbi:CooT family nickel-binding protein [Desulfovermiculus halophilus]|jgi:predicted RNA-binding protein|uniref:CooT family nickel-binding protein n=1 Tax=Desulfovermiculus halophilus TaxID=339722 RepID=UPI000480D615|nr:CooT family nickel-binding protein [Desulfovermiculus halophilus]